VTELVSCSTYHLFINILLNIMTTKQEAIDKMLIVIPYFRDAVAKAKETGVPKLAVTANKPDGSGEIIMSFDCEEFFADLALIVDAPVQTEEDTMKSKALQFLHKHGLKGTS
jgi:hypothetical protein